MVNVVNVVVEVVVTVTDEIDDVVDSVPHCICTKSLISSAKFVHPSA